MIYPNIHIITRKKNVYFAHNHNQLVKKTTHVRNFLQNEYNLDSHTAIIIISQIIEEIGPVISYLQTEKISKIYFFIDDVFRTSLLDYPLCKNHTIGELETINHIVNCTGIKNYRVFHCEKINDWFRGFYVEYADLFLNDFICMDPPYPLRLRNKKNFLKIKYSVSCLNNRNTIHRQLIATLLFKNKNSKTTLNQYAGGNYIYNNQLIVFDQLSENTQMQLNIAIPYCDRHYRKQKFRQRRVEQHGPIPMQYIQQSFVNIVTETTFTVQYPYISEKSIKPMLCYRPFVLLGAPGCLKQLKSFGFKTFNDWWDESYDQIEDHTERFEKVYSIIQTLLQTDHKDLRAMLKEMGKVLTHNRRHVKNIKKYLLPSIN